LLTLDIVFYAYCMSVILEGQAYLLNMWKETLERHCGPLTEIFCLGFENLQWHLDKR
jgi:hypothetical protein